MIETKPKRRWFRFGLRTLFIAITLISILIAPLLFWYRGRERERRGQEDIALRLKMLGAQVLLGETNSRLLKMDRQSAHIRSFSAYLLGQFRKQFNGDANTDKILDELRGITSVRSVTITIHPFYDFGGHSRYAHYRELSDDTIRKLNDISSLEEPTVWFAGEANGVYWPESERRAALLDIQKKLPRIKLAVAGGFG